DVYVKVGTFHFLADFVVIDFDADPRVPLILRRFFLKTRRALIDVFEGELTLRVGKEAITFNLDQTSRYLANFNDMTAKRIDVIDMACEEYSQEVLGDDKLPVIIAKDLSVEAKTALITVLKSHKRAIAWKLFDIKGIDPGFCTHKILMEEDFKPARCMMAIFYDMIEKTMEVFMDDFSVFKNSFQSCLSYLERMLKRCEDNQLCLNWEKSHFMVKEGIVLGHKFSKEGIKVDKAKVDVITKLPHPTTVKGIRSFLGHADFYYRFIKDFSKIARPMTRLLEKDTPFIFSKECVEAFQTLKRKLTEAPILIAPDWDMPFELMCYASDFAIGAVLGQRQDKHFRPIYYSSKTMTEAKSNYTTTKEKMLAVVYAFEKF
nr:reverse transcriptase domain-containing protein [Tanacetum cinerariifolium]